MNAPDLPAIIRRKDLTARLGLPRSTIYDMMAAGTFPRPIQLGPRSVGWLVSEVSDFLAERANRRGRA